MSFAVAAKQLGVSNAAVTRGTAMLEAHLNMRLINRSTRYVSLTDAGLTPADIDGIVRCDMIAEGIIAAVKEVGVRIPVIVRLEGTNAPLAREILANSGLAITAASDLTDAATKAVAMAGAHS